MFCTECGTKLPDGAKFCFQCGKQVAQAERATRQRPPANIRSCRPGKTYKMRPKDYAKDLSCNGWEFYDCVVDLEAGFKIGNAWGGGTYILIRQEPEDKVVPLNARSSRGFEELFVRDGYAYWHEIIGWYRIDIFAPDAEEEGLAYDPQ